MLQNQKVQTLLTRPKLISPAIMAFWGENFADDDA